MGCHEAPDYFFPFSADSRQAIAVFTREANWRIFVRKSALSGLWFPHMDPHHDGNVNRLGRTIHPQPGFSCPQQHVRGAEFMDEVRKRNHENRGCALVPVPGIEQNDNDRPPSFVDLELTPRCYFKWQ